MDGELLGAVAVLGITSLPPDQAAADLLAYLRGHWAIEVHIRRDVVFGEDASRIGRAHRAWRRPQHLAGIFTCTASRTSPLSSRLPPQPLPAPAAAPWPHDTAGAEPKPRRDLTAHPPCPRQGTPGRALRKTLHDQQKHDHLSSRGAGHPYKSLILQVPWARPSEPSRTMGPDRQRLRRVAAVAAVEPPTAGRPLSGRGAEYDPPSHGDGQAWRGPTQRAYAPSKPED